MKIGIMGLPQTGKKTLFEILTNRKPTENELASKKPIKGIVEVKDPRFDMLVKTYKPKKEARVRIEISRFKENSPLLKLIVNQLHNYHHP